MWDEIKGKRIAGMLKVNAKELCLLLEDGTKIKLAACHDYDYVWLEYDVIKPPGEGGGWLLLELT